MYGGKIMEMRIIKDFINILEEDKSIDWIDAKILMTSQDKYEDEFMEILNVMKLKGYIQTYKPTNKRMPEIKLTPKGAFHGKKYIKNYDKLFNDITSLIAKNPKQFNKDVSLFKQLNERLIFIGAVLTDLENQKYIKLEQMADGLYFKFTDRGRDYIL